mmetsp:Transcript_932/g.3723  ORF Transcript_932/g.3723 Transcript_932/m.3723 type:complete len:228 (+) Transcript_932:555-1238(+)
MRQALAGSRRHRGGQPRRAARVEARDGSFGIRRDGAVSRGDFGQRRVRAGGAPARSRDGVRGAPAGVVQRTVRDVPSKEPEVRGRRRHDGRHGDGGAAGDTVAGSRGRGRAVRVGGGAESRDGGASRGDRLVPRVSHQAAAAGRHRSADDRHRARRVRRRQGEEGSSKARRPVRGVRVRGSARGIRHARADDVGGRGERHGDGGGGDGRTPGEVVTTERFSRFYLDV